MNQAVPPVQLATAPGCAYCPTMKQQLEKMAARGLVADLQIIDISKTPDFASKHRIRSVPWLKIGDLIFNGVLTQSELEYWLSHANSDDGIRQYISIELENGRLSNVGQLIRTHSDWLAIATPLLADMEAPIQARIGMSALIESLQDQTLLQTILPLLIDYTRHKDARVRGDACHLLVNIPGAEAKQALRSRLQDPDAEVREIAGESLASMG